MRRKITMLSVASLVSLSTIIILLFSGEPKAIENNNSVVENSNNRIYIRGDDTQLLHEYNMSLLQMQHNNLIEQKYINKIKNINKPIDKTVDIKNLSIIEKDPKYTEEDLYLLSHLIQGEGGSDFITTEHQLLIGNVALNRVKSDKFPNTLKEVIFQKGQYQSVHNKQFYNKPSKQAVKNAKLLLEGKRYCPDSVVFQAEFKQGNGTYKIIKTIISKTYFCYE